MNVPAAQLIRTERLELLPVQPDHAREMATVLADPGLYTFTGGEPPGVEELRSTYLRWGRGSPDPQVRWLNWVVRLPTEELAGQVQATVDVGAQPTALVAWTVGRPWQGQGVAQEAARSVVAWLADQGVRVVRADIHPGNVASQRVAAAVGLRPTEQMVDGEVRWERQVPVS